MIPSWLAGLALAGSSIFVFPGIGDTIREPKWVWMWACAGLAIFYLRQMPRISVFALPFIGYCLFQPFAFAPAVVVWPFCVNIICLLALSRANTEDPPFAKMLAVASWCQVVLFILQLFGFDPLFTSLWPGENPSIMGFFGQHTIFGAWIAPLSWFWFAMGNWLLFGLCAIAAFCTMSAFTIFAWVAGLIGYLLWVKPKYGYAVTAFTAICFLVGLNSNHSFFSDSKRFQIWRMILWAAEDRPWLGYGMDSFSRQFPRLQGIETLPWIQAHSEPLELLFGGGWVGVGLALLLFVPLWQNRRNWWGNRDCLPWFLALTAILANGLGNFPLHIAPIALFAAMAYFHLVRASPPESNLRESE